VTVRLPISILASQRLAGKAASAGAVAVVDCYDTVSFLRDHNVPLLSYAQLTFACKGAHLNTLPQS